jgi:hypothetical protein
MPASNSPPLGITKVINYVRYGLPTGVGQIFGPSTADGNGNTFASLVVIDNVSGLPVQPTTQAPTADALAPGAGLAPVVALDIVPYAYLYNGATWDRTRAAPDNADAQAALGLGTQGVVARLQGWNGATYDRVGTQGDNADAVPVATLGHVKAWAHNGLFNGTTWDRQRGNVEGIALPSLVRNGATFDSADIVTYNARGIICFLNITAVPGIVTVNGRIQFKDPASGVYIDAPVVAGSGSFLPISSTSAALTTLIFQLGNMSFDAGANNFSSILPRTIRIRTTHSGAGNFTYSVGYSLMQ